MSFILVQPPSKKKGRDDSEEDKVQPVLRRSSRATKGLGPQLFNISHECSPRFVKLSTYYIGNQCKLLARYLSRFIHCTKILVLCRRTKRQEHEEEQRRKKEEEKEAKRKAREERRRKKEERNKKKEKKVSR